MCVCFPLCPCLGCATYFFTSWTDTLNCLLFCPNSIQPFFSKCFCHRHYCPRTAAIYVCVFLWYFAFNLAATIEGTQQGSRASFSYLSPSVAYLLANPQAGTLHAFLYAAGNVCGANIWPTLCQVNMFCNSMSAENAALEFLNPKWMSMCTLHIYTF